MVAKNVHFIIPRSLSSIYSSTGPFLVLFGEWSSLFSIFPPPGNVANMSGNWLNDVENLSKLQIKTGLCALVWAIWNCWNVFF
jgi:hypothetical protein